MKIYVGNMPFAMTAAELQEIFEVFGTVEKTNIVIDRETNRPRGFAFVEMPDSNSANAAIAALNGSEQSGRRLVVNEARRKEDRPRRDFRDPQRRNFSGEDRNSFRKSFQRRSGF